jgi:O-succinylbenzoate synthase
MELGLSYRRYRLRLRHTVRTATAAWTEREGLYVRVERQDGSVGYAEAAPIPSFGTESVDEAEEALARLGDRLDPEAIAGIPDSLPTLRQALLTSVHGRSEPALHRSLPVAALLPAGRAALGAAPALAEVGFRTFKWKVGVGAPDDERAIMDDLIGVLPGGSLLRLDANGAWDVRTAGRWLDHVSDRPVEFVEQPIAADSRGIVDTLLGLASDTPVPIALDESVTRDQDVGRWLDAGWRGAFILKTSLLADPKSVIRRLAAAGSRVVFSSALETALGAEHALRYAFAWPGSVTALGFGVWPLFENAAFDGPAAAPFLRSEDAERIDPEALWNALP